MTTIEGTLFREPGTPPGVAGLVLIFFEDVVKDERASRDGPPVFFNTHKVRVMVAGARSNEGPIYELARQLPDGTWKKGDGYRRFGKPYEEWKDGQAPSQSGTPLEQWPLMDRAMVATLKAVHIYTVQQLAELSDGQLETGFRRGGREWRAKAQEWLAEAKTAAGDVEARARIAKLEQDNTELQQQVRELLTKQNTLGFDKPRGRRNRTVEEEETEVAAAVSEAPEGRL